MGFHAGNDEGDGRRGRAARKGTPRSSGVVKALSVRQPRGCASHTKKGSFAPRRGNALSLVGRSLRQGGCYVPIGPGETVGKSTGKLNEGEGG